MSLLLDDLCLHRTDGVRLLGPLGLALDPGDRLALVGESGSGKSLLAQAIFDVLPLGVVRTAGQVAAFGTRLDRPSPQRDRIRGARLAWVPQDPLQTLNPRLTLGEHLALLPALHRAESHDAALARLRPLLDRLGLPPEPAFLDRLPHQASGGQRQRVCLAQALACDPDLLILDEPTSALDTLAQRAYLDLVLELQRERGLGFLWITHDLAVAAAVSERLLVLYGGAPLEDGPTGQLLASPRHPYTARLLDAARRAPSLETGFLPAPPDRPVGCPFQPRCTSADDGCAHWRPWQGSPAHGWRCEHPLRPADWAGPCTPCSEPST